MIKKCATICLVLLAFAVLLSGCGKEVETKPIELTNHHEGQYYSIFYPDGFDISTSDLDASITGEGINLIVKKVVSENAKRGDLQSIAMFRMSVEQKAKQEDANLAVTETNIGAEKAFVFEYEGTTKYGLLYAMPLDGKIILVGSENPQELGEGEIAARRVELIKAIARSFRITRPDYFAPSTNNDQNNQTPKDTTIETKTFENAFFKFDLPKNWTVSGEDMVTIQPSDSQSISAGQEISITNIENAGKDCWLYATDIAKTFKSTESGGIVFGSNSYIYNIFTIEGQERIHLFIGKDARVVMINAASNEGKLLPEHEIVLKTFVMK